jgi:hypothetical protein
MQMIYLLLLAVLVFEEVFCAAINVRSNGTDSAGCEGGNTGCRTLAYAMNLTGSNSRVFNFGDGTYHESRFSFLFLCNCGFLAINFGNVSVTLEAITAGNVLLDSNVTSITTAWFTISNGGFTSRNISYKYNGGNYYLFRVIFANCNFSIINSTFSSDSSLNSYTTVFNFEKGHEVTFLGVVLSNFNTSYNSSIIWCSASVSSFIARNSSFSSITYGKINMH